MASGHGDGLRDARAFSLRLRLHRGAPVFCAAAPSLLLLLSLPLSTALACREASQRPTDVILVTLDTTRADHLGVYGYERDITPFLDRFARDAVTFQRAWAAGAWTLPTHASMLTGKYPSSHGARFNQGASNVALSEVLEGDFFARHKASRLPEDEVTLAELLSERGYATAAFAGGPWLAPPFGLMQGYELQDSLATDVGGRSAEELTNRLIAWLAALPADRPAHALINYFDPHSPYEPPPGFDDLPGVAIPIDPEQNEIFVNGGRRLSARQRRAVVDRYDGEIRYMDHHFGRLIDALREMGRFDDALIIVLADHGELLGEHGFLGHGRWLYEGVLRIPLLVHFPGGEGAGKTEAALISQVDLLPMIASRLGFELAAPVDGVAIGARTHVFAEVYRDPFSVSTYKNRYDRDLSALVRWPWKLIASDTGIREIYELQHDPSERRDRKHAAMGDALERALADARAAIEPRHEAVAPSDVPPELQENLRDLGYIE
ncbi:MAG: sulfatase [Myxococcota bacterium]